MLTGYTEKKTAQLRGKRGCGSQLFPEFCISVIDNTVYKPVKLRVLV